MKNCPLFSRNSNKVVRKRVKILLFRKTGIAVRCFHPENLEIEF
jgi:hypothetical protein